MLKKINLYIFKKKVEYTLFFISCLLFFFIFVILIIAKFIFLFNFSILYGFGIGYLFLILGYAVTVYSTKWMLAYRSITIYIVAYILKTIIYAIPIYVASLNISIFNIYMIIFGLSLIWISELLLLLKNEKNNKKGVLE